MITNMVELTGQDAALTPVTHTFTPSSRIAVDTARWVDSEHNNGVLMGAASIAHQLKEPKQPGGVYRQRVSFAVPKVDFTVPTAPKLVGVSRVNMDVLFPDSLSEQERKDVFQLFLQLTARGYANKIGDNIVACKLPY